MTRLGLCDMVCFPIQQLLWCKLYLAHHIQHIQPLKNTVTHSFYPKTMLHSSKSKSILMFLCWHFAMKWLVNWHKIRLIAVSQNELLNLTHISLFWNLMMLDHLTCHHINDKMNHLLWLVQTLSLPPDLW